MDKPTEFWTAYEHIEGLYKTRQYDEAASAARNLLRDVLARIYTDTKKAAGNNRRGALTRLEKNIFKRRAVDDADAEQLAEIFERGRILNIAKGNVEFLPILKTRNLNAVAALSKTATRNSASPQEETLKRNAYELFIFLTELLGFMGWAREDLVVHDPERPVSKKTFALDLDTGIMTNPLDQSRNVSFKAITFGVMLGNICAEFINRLTISHSDESAPATDLMSAILFRAGANAGTRFGLALAAELSTEKPIIERIDLWCRFDTNVGWGRFENALVIREHGQYLAGSIVLHNNFLTADRKPADVNICSLMSGYISGVLSAMLAIKVHIIHDSSAGHCAQTQPGKTTCEFFVSDLSSLQ